MSRSVYAYKPKRLDDEPLIDAVLALVERHPRWGFPKNRKRLHKLGHCRDQKRIYRVYVLLKLNIRRKAKRRLPSRNPLPLVVPPRMNVCWSMDFMSSVLQHGHRFRTFSIVDDFNREALGIDINSGITDDWIDLYNYERPHDSLNDMTPMEYLQAA